MYASDNADSRVADVPRMSSLSRLQAAPSDGGSGLSPATPPTAKVLPSMNGSGKGGSMQYSNSHGNLPYDSEEAVGEWESKQVSNKHKSSKPNSREKSKIEDVQLPKIKNLSKGHPKPRQGSGRR